MQTFMRRIVFTRRFQGLTTVLCTRSQNMKKLLLAAVTVLSLVSVSGRAYAGNDVVRGATVVEVGNTSSYEDVF